jgi:hypothetical protein
MNPRLPALLHVGAMSTSRPAIVGQSYRTAAKLYPDVLINTSGSNLAKRPPWFQPRCLGSWTVLTYSGYVFRDHPEPRRRLCLPLTTQYADIRNI